MLKINSQTPYSIECEELETGSFMYRLLDGTDDVVFEMTGGSAWSASPETLRMMGETLIINYNNYLSEQDNVWVIFGDISTDPEVVIVNSIKHVVSLPRDKARFIADCMIGRKYPSYVIPELIKTDVLLLTERQQSGVNDSVSVKWTTWDVVSEDVRPDLTHNQARQVLALVKQTHDANVGINWDTLRQCAEQLYPQGNK